jgi:hypothetical protein
MSEQTTPVFCARCGNECIPNGITTGYGIMQDESKICFDCCALDDMERMDRDGKITLYLTQKDGKNYVSNWPGTLKFGPLNVSKGRHNIAGVRYDVWFGYAGYIWHGYTIGDYTQICHVKRTKTLARWSDWVG